MNKWDLRFLSLAKTISKWSKDPSTKVGAVIVDDQKRIVSLGFNGFPKHVHDSDERLLDRDTKYKLIIHAELNAILYADKNLSGCTLYVYPLPSCIRCSTIIIQKEIKRVVSPIHNNERWHESCAEAKLLMEEAGIIVDELNFV